MPTWKANRATFTTKRSIPRFRNNGAFAICFACLCFYFKSLEKRRMHAELRAVRAPGSSVERRKEEEADEEKQPFQMNKGTKSQRPDIPLCPMEAAILNLVSTTRLSPDTRILNSCIVASARSWALTARAAITVSSEMFPCQR